MNDAVSVLALSAVGLVGTALGGPWLIRRAAPVLSHTPRLAAGTLFGITLAWVAALTAVGPALFLASRGAVDTSVDARGECLRCLVSTSGFPAGLVDAGFPLLPLLATPLVAVLVLSGVALVCAGRRTRATARTAAALHVGARRIRVHGHDVLLVRSRRPFAFALPRRHGGVVVSQGAIGALDELELLAVLEHERAHLRQRHHLVTAVVSCLTAPLRGVPLIDAAARAIPLYLEIAADDAARRRAGTPALASALLVLGDPGRAAGVGTIPTGALHAAGPDRIGHLVAARSRRRDLPAALAVGALPVLLAATWLAALLPYADALLVAC